MRSTSTDSPTPGRSARDNQDHFLVCSLRKQMVVQHTSLAEADQLLAGSERRRPADDGRRRRRRRQQGRSGQPQRARGRQPYVSRSMHCYYAAGSAGDQEFSEALQEGASLSHDELVRRGEEEPEFRGMATTLTLYLGHWPRALSAPGGRQPLLPAPRRRADPDHPGPDHGAGADRPRRHDAGRTPAARASSTPSPAPSAGARPPRRSPSSS